MMSKSPRAGCSADSRRFYLHRTEVVIWHAGCTRLDSPPDVFRACEDSPMRFALCAVCSTPLGLAPFTVHTVMGAGPAPIALHLIPSVTVPIHSTCQVPPPAELSNWMIDALNTMLD